MTGFWIGCALCLALHLLEGWLEWRWHQRHESIVRMRDARGTYVRRWGPFTDRDRAVMFAAFVSAEIDPAEIVLRRYDEPGRHHLYDPAFELMIWRRQHLDGYGLGGDR